MKKIEGTLYRIKRIGIAEDLFVEDDNEEGLMNFINLEKLIA